MRRQTAISARIDENILGRISTHVFSPAYIYKPNRNDFLNRAADVTMRLDDWYTWLRATTDASVSKSKKREIILKSPKTPEVLRGILRELL